MAQHAQNPTTGAAIEAAQKKGRSRRFPSGRLPAARANPQGLASYLRTGAGVCAGRRRRRDPRRHLVCIERPLPGGPKALFRRYSTDLVTPELLAALAQVEASGNPVARTYWRWSLTPQPFEVYRPASSSVGMYQMTDGTFAAARHYCIRRHAVVEDGPWNDWRSCWLNRFYTRVIPSHAVELTAAYLDRSIAGILALHPTRSVTLEREQELAALIHLCGAGAADLYVRHGMRLVEGQRCGDHPAQEYVSRVDQARRVFQALEKQESW
jgi:hypothetical protein